MASVLRGKKIKMQAAKLQDLIMQLSKRLIMRTNMKLSKAEKIKRRVERQAKKFVEENNDYQRSELPVKGDGQWILFRWPVLTHSSCNLIYKNLLQQHISMKTNDKKAPACPVHLLYLMHKMIPLSFLMAGNPFMNPLNI